MLIIHSFAVQRDLSFLLVVRTDYDKLPLPVVLIRDKTFPQVLGINGVFYLLPVAEGFLQNRHRQVLEILAQHVVGVTHHHGSNLELGSDCQCGRIGHQVVAKPT